MIGDCTMTIIRNFPKLVARTSLCRPRFRSFQHESVLEARRKDAALTCFELSTMSELLASKDFYKTGLDVHVILSPHRNNLTDTDGLTVAATYILKDQIHPLQPPSFGATDSKPPLVMDDLSEKYAILLTPAKQWCRGCNPLGVH